MRPDSNDQPDSSERDGSTPTPEAATPGSRGEKTPEPSSSAASRGRRRSIRIVKILAGGLLVLAILAVAGWFIVTTPTVLGRLVAWHLSRVSKTTISIHSIESLGQGKFVIHDLSLDAPGWGREAGRVGEVDRVVATLDPAGLWRLEAVILDLIVESPRIRIAERAETPGDFNLLAFVGRTGRTTSGALPRIAVVEADVEVGVLLPSGIWELSGATRLSGELLPERINPGWYAVDLTEVGTSSSSLSHGLHLGGRFNERTLECDFALGRVRLDARLRSLCTLIGQAWWDRLQIEGEVKQASLRREEGGTLLAELSIDGAAMTLPIDPGDRWVRLRGARLEHTSGRPRMRVQTGTLRFDRNQLVLEKLVGELVGSDDLSLAGVPFRLGFEIRELPPLSWSERTNWLDEALQIAPFSLDLELEKFVMPATLEPGSIELPLVVGDLIEALGMATWTLDTLVHVERARPTINADGVLTPSPVQFSGRAMLADASMRYKRFVYPLEGVEAFFRFDESKVEIEYLRGRGPSGGEVLVTGRIAPPGPKGVVDLRIVGRDIPLNEALTSALPGPAQATVRTLMSETSWASLGSAGLLPDEAAIQRLRQRRQALLDGPPSLDEESQTRRAWSIEALESMIDAGTFGLGGTIDVEVAVHREPAPSQIELSGVIDLAGTTGVFAPFPYPFRVTSGSVRITADKVEIVAPGATLVTAGGGAGKVTGAVDIPMVDGRREVLPHLRIVVADDSVNPLLLAAIPPGREHRLRIDPAHPWPGGTLAESAEVLDAAALEGKLSAVADITAAPGERARFDVVVALERGRARPTERMGKALADEGLKWPEALGIENLAAVVRVTPDLVEVSEVTGVAAGARLRASAAIDLLSDPTVTSAAIALESLTLAPWMVDMAPPAASTAVAAIWEHYQPSGRIDVEARAHVAGPDPAELEIAIRPHQVRATVEGQPLDFDCRSGVIRLPGPRLQVEGLVVGISQNGAPQGEIHASCDLGLPGATDGNVQARWEAGRFESPLVANTLRRIGLDTIADRISDSNPRGEFSAEVEATYRDGEAVGFAASIVPAGLDFDSNGVVVPLQFEGGRLLATPERIRIDRLRGTHESGRFEFDGAWQLGNRPGDQPGNQSGTASSLRPRGAVVIDIDSQSLSPALRAVIPAVVSRNLDAIGLVIDGPLRVTGTVRTDTRADEPTALEPGPGDPDARETVVADSEWFSAFDGAIALEGASFDAGFRFEDLSGELRIEASGGDQGIPTFILDADLDRFRIADRLVEPATAHMHLAESGEELIIDHVRGTLGGGVALATGRVATSAEGDYNVRLEIGGVSVSSMTLTSDQGLGPDHLGQVDGRIDLGGSRRDPGGRRGRGSIRITNGRMAEMPITLGLLQLTQLMLPLNASLARADIAFFVSGEVLTFERLELQGDTLRLLGTGSLNLETMTLETRFSTRGTLFLVSDLVRSVSDNLFAIEVSGPLTSPTGRLVPLPLIDAALPWHRGRSAASAPPSPSAIAPLPPLSGVPNQSP